MVIVDVPVQLDQHFFIFIHIGGVKSTRVKAILCLKNTDGPVHIRLRHTHDITDGLGV